MTLLFAKNIPANRQSHFGYLITVFCLVSKVASLVPPTLGQPFCGLDKKKFWHWHHSAERKKKKNHNYSGFKGGIEIIPIFHFKKYVTPA